MYKKILFFQDIRYVAIIRCNLICLFCQITTPTMRRTYEKKECYLNEAATASRLPVLRKSWSVSRSVCKEMLTLRKEKEVEVFVLFQSVYFRRSHKT